MSYICDDVYVSRAGTSLWMRNIQMGISSVALGKRLVMMSVIVHDDDGNDMIVMMIVILMS